MEAVVTIATMYAGPFVGQPLYCSTPDTPLYYAPDTQPWIALPVEQYQSGDVVCGDLYYIRFQDGKTLMARALDAGPFSRFCVVQPDGSCPSIGVDVPSYFWQSSGISAKAEVYPIGRRAREHRTSRAGDHVERPSPPGVASWSSAQGG